MSSRLRKERHSISDLKIHLVCVTKYRRKVFTSKSLALIEKSFKEVAEKMNFQVLEFNGESDHVHAAYAGLPTDEAGPPGGATCAALSAATCYRSSSRASGPSSSPAPRR